MYLFPDNRDLFSALPGELEEMCLALGEPKYRAGQIFDWLHKRLVTSVDEMSNIPASLKEHLRTYEPFVSLKTGKVLESEDGTRKLQVLLADGNAVETVLIPDGDRLTQCISSQVGCAVGCIFCRSGADGLTRNLKASEIIGQIHLGVKHYFPGERLRNVVLMGVGEPLHNTREVLRAIELMSHKQGYDLSTRRITLSTVGLPRKIKQLGEATNGSAALAVSLHAADEETRKRLVPGVSASLADIIQALKEYPLPKRRRITIEYVLVKGINDSDADARKLAKLLSNIPSKVNLLPLNPHDRTELEPPSEKRVLAFQKILLDKGISAFLRKRRGSDVGAACGQLLAHKKD